MKIQIFAPLLAASLALAGCASFPEPSYVGSGTTGPTVKDLVTHIQCQIYNEIAKNSNQVLVDSHYVGKVDLSLKVQGAASLMPSLSFGSIPVAPNNFTLVVGGTLTGDAQNTFTSEYTIDLKKLKGAKPSCATTRDARLFDLSSDDLGVVEMFAAARTIGMVDNVAYIEKKDGAEPQPCASKDASLDCIGPLPQKFGGTVQFTVTKSANIGPTWTLKHFKGVGGSTGLVSGTRVNTDFITFGFAPPAPKRLDHGIALLSEDDAISAARESQSYVTQQILQNLLNNQQGTLP